MTKSYIKITDATREELVDLITSQNLSIRDAANKLEINYENAKAIYRTFRL